MPLISIITICFNNLHDLIQTCKSVDCQDVPPYEHIIIDGSSNSEIKTYLENNQQPNYRKWICERDKGIADAFNKGVKKAVGDIVLVLNSGDRLYDHTVLRRVSALFDEDKSIMWCNGKLQMIRGGIEVIVGKPFEKRKLYRGMRGVFHPTMYVRRELFSRHGFFDATVKMAMDYDFLCRIADEKNSFIDYPLAIFDPTGVSTTKYLEAMNESYAAYRKYFGYSVKQTLWSWRLALLHHLLESKTGKWLYAVKVKLGLENA
jgi:glycosyltransferase involved in cell wall biosynthesis